MKKILFAVALLARSCQLFASEKPVRKAQARPNVILIFTDDQGYGDLSCYDSKTIRTPHD